jgi:hypothetical protein
LKHGFNSLRPYFERTSQTPQLGFNFESRPSGAVRTSQTP